MDIDDAGNTPPIHDTDAGSRWRVLVFAGIITALALALLGLARRLVGPVERRRAYPPGPDAIGHDEAAELAASLVTAGRPRRADLAVEFAPTVATSVDPLLHGRRYFPRIIEDFEGARDHIHILIYGYKPGDIGQRIFDVLEANVREGVKVRLEVDSVGSEINLGSQELFRALKAAGIETVANHGLPIDRILPAAVGGYRSGFADLLHFDHRKMIVVDGKVGYVGGSGFEDHFADERFYDVMCRLTGPVVAQLQLVFLKSWAYHGGVSPSSAELETCFPAETMAAPSDGSRQVSATWLWNVPGTGHHPISDALEAAFAVATERIEIVNPYISNRAILDLLHRAAERGVAVRIIVPGKPTPPFPAAAFRHHYERLIEAGAEILEHPEMAHAKVAIVDDQAFIGGCNLDDLSLFRNDELDILLVGGDVVEQVDREVFAELREMSIPASPTRRPHERLWNAVMDRLSPLL